MNHTLYLVRGASGSGKSTLVKSIINSKYNGTGFVFSTDEFFYVNGVYQFEPSKLGIAHGWNLARAYRAIQEYKSPIFIDNTHTQKWEAKRYVQFGIEAGYEIEIIEPQTSWWISRDVVELAKRNTHSVSQEIIESMIARWESDFGDIDSIIQSSIPNTKKAMNPVVHIVRGLPGSGKQALADQINKQYFENGFVLFSKDFELIPSDKVETTAQEWNLDRVELLMDKELSPIIVVDVFAKESDIARIKESAKLCGYEVRVWEPRTSWWIERDFKKLSLNSGISEAELRAMAERWENFS